MHWIQFREEFKQKIDLVNEQLVFDFIYCNNIQQQFLNGVDEQSLIHEVDSLKRMQFDW